MCVCVCVWAGLRLCLLSLDCFYLVCLFVSVCACLCQCVHVYLRVCVSVCIFVLRMYLESGINWEEIVLQGWSRRCEEKRRDAAWGGRGQLDCSVPPERAGHQLVCRGLGREERHESYFRVCVVLRPYAAAGLWPHTSACVHHQQRPEMENRCRCSPQGDLRSKDPTFRSSGTKSGPDHQKRTSEDKNVSSEMWTPPGLWAGESCGGACCQNSKTVTRELWNGWWLLVPPTSMVFHVLLCLNFLQEPWHLFVACGTDCCQHCGWVCGATDGWEVQMSLQMLQQHPGARTEDTWH